MATQGYGVQVAKATRGFISALLACGLLLTGCHGTVLPGRATTTTTTTTTSAPSLPPAAEAQQVIDYYKGYLDVQLPADAQQLRVTKPPLEDFRAKALISFTAPRDQVISQTCRGLKNIYPETKPPLISASDEGRILEYASVTINRDDYGYCSGEKSGREAFVLVPKTDDGTTYVILYHVPYR
ncbi:Uncharacterised protein [Mycobacteroides abscessus subsp. abscessus]|uniref:hypothetical protein n=1 Tax=Mycobacteroides abscessus TaxID=36809 RepID=UPI00092B357E|nr:hypothetical protein [Mycobacteroides abscessus]SHU33360.1 Uncharacterised protein [Mycobacteroides abscessus subsp. bolletii]SHW18779.1 Uncharacterised protein [Mycobacteroides abscessus subsp. bolletii]SHW23576.1 Uncharacterised protein [Mycobacteroides abscessus subsp. bolletii]SHW72599.1 Uncharacterised protein [Mycobacteroides abscessus subsp. bolletii]SID92063.1 Uncharacterised protein [Mycobacteroides abscessus subsp. abscessus]